MSNLNDLPQVRDALQAMAPGIKIEPKVRAKSKFVPVFIIQGNYGCGWEDECCDTDRKLARQTLREYRENSQYPSRMVLRRVPREKYESGDF